MPMPRNAAAPAANSAEPPSRNEVMIEPSTSASSDIDVDDAPDDQDAQDLHDGDHGDQDVAEDVVHHRLHQVGAHRVEHHAEHRGHGRDDPALELALGGERVDLALQAEAL